MLKRTSFLVGHVFLGSISVAAAAPLDTPGTVYIDGLPCNRPCQDYMTWSRQVSGQRSAGRTQPMAAQPITPQPSAARPRHYAKKGDPQRPARVATLPKSAQPAATDMGVDKVEAVPEPAATASVPTPLSDPRADANDGAPLDQVATVPPSQEAPAASPAPSPDSEVTSSPRPNEPPSDAKTDAASKTAALSMANPEQTVAILLVRDGIKSLAGLSNKKVAIDVSQAAEIPDIKSAMSKAGVSDVEISEDKKFALGRVMDGEVAAGIISLASPEEAALWTGVPGYTVLKLPLARTKVPPG